MARLRNTLTKWNKCGRSGKRAEDPEKERKIRKKSGRSGKRAEDPVKERKIR